MSFDAAAKKIYALISIFVSEFGFSQEDAFLEPLEQRSDFCSFKMSRKLKEIVEKHVKKYALSCVNFVELNGIWVVTLPGVNQLREVFLHAKQEYKHDLIFTKKIKVARELEGIFSRIDTGNLKPLRSSTYYNNSDKKFCVRITLGGRNILVLKYCNSTAEDLIKELGEDFEPKANLLANEALKRKKEARKQLLDARCK